jgi:hypothetical protein
MTKEGFQTIAEIISGIFPKETIRKGIANEFAVELLRRFPTFDHEVFLEACGFPVLQNSAQTMPDTGKEPKIQSQGHTGPGKGK